MLDYSNPDVLREHRELQLLRAAGTAASSRRAARRNHKAATYKTQAELADWVSERFDKLAQVPR